MDETKYELKKEIGGIGIYVARNPADTVHLSRYVALQREEIFAAGGATRDVLEKVMTAIVTACDETLNPKGFRSEVTTLAQSILYRLKYPIDEHCLLREGFILTYLDGEPELLSDYWMDKKWQMVRDNEEAYAFFLQWGLVNSTAYASHLDILKEPGYFQNREETIRSILGGKAIQ